MELPYFFNDFLASIRLTQAQSSDAKTGHRTLRDRLHAYEDFGELLVGTFLQGSYRRSTAVRPSGEKRADVDVITVTRLSSEEFSPEEIVPIFIPFLDKYYKGKWELQGRSFGISLSYVDLDLVVTAAPSEAEVGIYASNELEDETTLEEGQVLTELSAKAAEWQDSPLLIPNQELNRWERTHPLEQIRWTQGKNTRCGTYYINVVKALKWWRRIKCPTPKYPKGYPVEHIIGVCCPNGVSSIAQGVTQTLEAISANYSTYAAAKRVPFFPDHGVPEHNVFGRVSGEDFAAFHAQCREAAKLSRAALNASSRKESADLWRELFGDKFPKAPDDSGGNGTKKGDQPSPGSYTPRTEPGGIEGGRFA